MIDRRLFANLAPHGVLKAFAWIDEARDERPHNAAVVCVALKKHLVAFRDEDDNCRTDFRICRKAAGRTDHRPLAATEHEAASAAQSLAKVITEIDRTDPDKREAEITRALTAAEHLAERFPGNAEIADAVGRLKTARDAHVRFLERRGGGMRLQHRFRPVPRR